MGHVKDAFAKLKSNLEITNTEEDKAKRRHANIRDHVRSHWTLSADFLTGSYARETKTKPLKDVDVFVVIDGSGPQASYREQSPAAVLDALLAILREKWEEAYLDETAVVVPYSGDEELLSVEVVPAFDRVGGGYLIPSPTPGQWLATDPTKHADASTDKNKACDGDYVPLVKMLKAINREMDEPVTPSFLLEVMALDILRPPISRYSDDIITFLATAAERINEPWPDPAGVGPDVNTAMSPSERDQAAAALHEAQGIAEYASDLEEEEHERQAVDEWRRIFGSRMPRP